MFDFQAAVFAIETAAKSKKSFPDVWHREKLLTIYFQRAIIEHEDSILWKLTVASYICAAGLVISGKSL